jgi:hypothetical protein
VAAVRGDGGCKVVADAAGVGASGDQVDAAARDRHRADAADRGDRRALRIEGGDDPPAIGRELGPLEFLS